MKLPPGVTERQMNHWVHIIFDDETQQAPGKGHPRQWKPENLRRLAVLGMLRPLGFELKISARLAREIAAGENSVFIAPGMTLIIDPDVVFADLEGVQND